jgi:hypothetical protein
MADSKDGSLKSATTDPSVPIDDLSDHLTGLKLFTTMCALSLVGFLMLLDVSVISTVSYYFSVE